ncbi:unnamed protein product [Pylaiella littoralis]
MMKLPFFGSSRASLIVRENQDAYTVWLEGEAMRMKKERRYLQYSTESDSDIDYDDA